MIIKFLSQAHSELIDAVAYFEGELNGLGQRLWDEWMHTLRGSHETMKCRACDPAGIGE